MKGINYPQVILFLLQGIFVSSLLLLLFRLRKTLGLGLLFAALGLIQFMQVFLASTVYVAITDSIIVSPGSVVLFTSTLFAILLVYIREDATETRKIIYALLIVNIVMSLLILTFRWNIEDASFHNPYNVSNELFDNNSWILFVGTIVLFFDSVLIIILFELISKYLKTLFLRISLTLLPVVIFDTVCFSFAIFLNSENLSTILFSGIIAKGTAILGYSLILTFYLKFIEKDELIKGEFRFKDIFHTLSYRQKFEQLKDEKELIAKESAQAIRQREVKFQNLTNASPVGIFLTRADGYTTYVNPKWCTISGISAEEAMGNGWLKSVHPEDREKLNEGWEQSVNQISNSNAQYRFVHPDGSVRWVLGQAVPEFDGENNITGYIGTITDITNIKLFEQEINRLKEKAEESDRLKSAFLANMSHEIRTPMNGILGFAQLLKEPDLNGARRNEFINLISLSGERMLNIINDIIDISKIEAGLTKPNYAETDICDLIGFVSNFFRPQIESKGLTFKTTVDVPEELKLVMTDKVKVVTILTNLVKNAVKFTRQGSIELNCSIHFRGLSPEVHFEVKDTGIGIPEERKAAIFDRFVQADIADKDALQGAGLGLSIAKAYAEMLNGTIEVESAPGKGSSFQFVLPVLASTRETENTQTIAHTNTSTLRKINLLIVEDDEISGILIKAYLNSYCKQIFQAGSAQDAIQICHSNPDIDLILMDIKLPEMSGDEAAIRIRQFSPKTVIIAQTAFAMEHEKQKYREIFDDYITKPILRDKLLSAIGKHFKLQ